MIQQVSVPLTKRAFVALLACAGLRCTSTQPIYDSQGYYVGQREEFDAGKTLSLFGSVMSGLAPLGANAQSAAQVAAYEADLGLHGIALVELQDQAVLERSGQNAFDEHGFLALVDRPVSNEISRAGFAVQANAAKRPLRLWAYGIGHSEGLELETHWDALAWLREQGFPVSPDAELHDDPASALAFCRAFEERRASLSYDVDGVVVKVSSLDQQRRLQSRRLSRTARAASARRR